MEAQIGKLAASGSPGYRPVIDGLRAVAVSSVVLYHADPSWLPGGYLGVDIFFVISGYLITSIIAEEISHGTFTILGFYERRIRRILPALVVVLTATWLAAHTLLTPDDFKQFAKSALATIGFVANHHFYLQTGYFGGRAEALPLLHMWSLAVEEQFYILWPLLLAFLFGRSPRHIAGTVAGLGVASFAINLVAVRHWPDAAFYWMLMRAWELLIGAFLALSATAGPKSRLMADGVSVAGLTLAAGGLAYIPDGAREAGVAALGPCLGAALLIWSSIRVPSFSGRLLALRPVVFVGLVSYSLYLWHWPLFALCRYQLDRDLTLIETLAVIASSLLLAILTWRFVERPFRQRKGGIPLPKVLITTGASLAVLAAVSLVAMLSKGMPWRWPPEVEMLLQKAEVFGINKRPCIETDAAGGICQLAKGDEGKPRILIWGDSHAEALIPAFVTLADRNGATLWSGIHYGCPPMQGLSMTGDPMRKGESCHADNARAMSFAMSAPLDSVVLIARWNEYSMGPPQSGVQRGNRQTELADEEDSRTGDVNQSVIDRSLRRTIKALVAKGRRVYVVLQVPYTGVDTPGYFVKHALPLPPAGIATIPIAEDHMRRSAWMRNLANELAGEFGVVVLDPTRTLCDQHACGIGAGDGVFYKDSNHLNQRGAELVEGDLKVVFEQGVSSASK